MQLNYWLRWHIPNVKAWRMCVYSGHKYNGPLSSLFFLHLASSIQPKIMTHTHIKPRKTIQCQETKQSTETNLEMIQMVELLDKDKNVTMIKRFKTR